MNQQLAEKLLTMLPESLCRRILMGSGTVTVTQPTTLDGSIKPQTVVIGFTRVMRDDDDTFERYVENVPYRDNPVLRPAMTVPCHPESMTMDGFGRITVTGRVERTWENLQTLRVITDMYRRGVNPNIQFGRGVAEIDERDGLWEEVRRNCEDMRAVFDEARRNGDTGD